MDDFEPSTGSEGITYTEDGTTISNLQFTFNAPGETHSFKFNIKNTGSINAILNTFSGNTSGDGTLKCTVEGGTDSTIENTICGGDGKNDGAVTYQVKYDNVDITDQGFSTVGLQDTNKKLAATEGTKPVEITVKYDASKITSETLPTKKVTVKLPDIVFGYIQDDSVE